MLFSRNPTDLYGHTFHLRKWCSTRLVVTRLIAALLPVVLVVVVLVLVVHGYWGVERSLDGQCDPQVSAARACVCSSSFLWQSPRRLPPSSTPTPVSGIWPCAMVPRCDLLRNVCRDQYAPFQTSHVLRPFGSLPAIFLQLDVHSKHPFEVFALTIHVVPALCV